jgi:hypothetical protein
MKCPNGFRLAMQTGPSKGKLLNAQLFEEMFKNIESELPTIPDFSAADGRSIPQKLPKNPVCVVTVLYEDESGNIRPIVTDDDRKWAAAQEKAHSRRPLGI